MNNTYTWNFFAGFERPSPLATSFNIAHMTMPPASALHMRGPLATIRRNMKHTILILISILVVSCSQEERNNVGDIPFDEQIDDKNFNPCNERKIKQYYVRRSSDTPPSYKGEKRGLEREILNRYQFPETEKENGYVTIRFIVNCKGETGRFRTEEMDFAYKTNIFDKKITGQLLEIVKNLNGWIPRTSGGERLDFYQYLTFKIEKGQIVKILP